jgi:hypothetical protein
MPEQEFDLSQMVKDFVLKGECATTIDVIKDEITAGIVNLPSESQLQIEKEMSQSTEGPAAILHGFSLAILSHVLKTYNDKDVKTVKEARELLGQLPGVVIDSMIKQQQAFEHAIAKALTGEEIENTFFETEPTSTDSTPE